MTLPIRILVVDDSAVFRMVLVRVLRRTSGFEVVGTASDGHEALEAAARLDPDVITLDLEMPGLDGLETLTRLLARRPTRVVMLSHATTSGAAVTFDALRLGAVEAIAKPETAWGTGPSLFVEDLVAKIRAAALVPLARIAGPSAAPTPSATRGSVPATRRTVGHAARRLVVVATSTGGPRALETLLAGLPDPLGAGIVVIQHMLTGFTGPLSLRLDRLGPLRVAEAATGDRILEDVVLVAPGDHHLLVNGRAGVLLVRSERVNGLRPAADVTLTAAAAEWGPRLLSVVLTGMGRDGTTGSEAVRANGGTIFAQDEASSTVYGMPRSIAEADLADRILPLDQLAGAIADWARSAVGPAVRPDPSVDLRNFVLLADTS